MSLRRITVICNLIIASLCVLNASAVEITTSQYVEANYRKFAASNQAELSLITEPGEAGRTTIEVLVLKKALELGGLKSKIRFNVLPTEGRIMANIANGIGLIGGPVWESEVDPRLNPSGAILRKNEMATLIFGHPSNARLFEVKAEKDLQKFTGVRVLHWKSMEARMKRMQIQSITALDRASVFKLIDSSRGDFTFMFPSPDQDMGQEINGIRLLPVPGVKISLNMSSHYVVSRVHPDGAATLKALNKGLKILRKRKEISRAFKAAGVIDERLADWEVLR